MSTPRLLQLLVVLSGVAAAQSGAPETLAVRVRAGKAPEPASPRLKTGDLTAYIEWTRDRKENPSVRFGAFSPCVEGPEIPFLGARALCTLKSKVCNDQNAAGDNCVFQYVTAGQSGEIVIDEGFSPPARPATLKGAHLPRVPGAQPHQPGDGVVVRTRKLEWSDATRVTVQDKPAVVARRISVHEAEIIVPQVDDGNAPVVVTSGTLSERAATLTIRTLISRRLTLAFDGEKVTLLKSEPYGMAAPPCIAHSKSDAGLLYRVTAAGKQVGCGVVTTPSRPAEIFLHSGPRRDRSRGPVFTIVVPWHRNENIEFEPGDPGKLSGLGFDPVRVRRFNSIQVTY